MKLEGMIDDGATVGRQKATAIVEAWQAGEDTLESLKSSLPPSVREEVDIIIKRSGLDMKTQRKLRQARITELLVQDDPKLVVEGAKLSQKEDGVGQGTVTVNAQFNHWSQDPPDGRTLEIDDEG